MKKTIVSLSFIACCLIIAGTGSHGADEKKAEKLKPIQPATVNLGRPVDFEEDILPILDDNCIACHNLGVAESKLNLEEVDTILKGGKRGTAVVPKNPEKSLLYQVASRGKEPAMPPLPNKVEAAALTPKQLGLLKQWILEGATKGEGGSKDVVQWQPLPSDLKAIYSTALSPWGRLAASGRANQIAVYDIVTAEQLTQLFDPALSSIQQDGKPMYGNGAAHRDFVHSLAFNHDGTLLASGGYRVVKLWQRPTNVRTVQIPSANSVTALAVSADGTWVAVGAADNSIKLFNTKDGKPGKVLAGHTAGITGLHFWPTTVDKTNVDQALAAAKTALQTAIEKADAAAIALKQFDPKFEKLDAEEAAKRKEQLTAASTAAAKAATAAVTAAQAAALAQTTFDKKVTQESKLFSSSLDKSIRVWKVADGSLQGHINTPSAVNDLTVNNDATQIISAGADNLLQIWAVPTDPAPKSEAVRQLKGHSKPVTSVALIRPAGKQIVSGSEDGTVRTWDLNNGRQIRSMKHGGPVTAVAARPDGQLVASAGSNNVAKLWQVSNGKQLVELKGDLIATRKVASLTDEQAVAKQKVALADTALKADDKNVKDREAAAKKATTAKTAADKALAEAQKKAKTATDALTAAKAALEKKKDDKGLQKKVTGTEKAATAANDVVKKAMTTQAATVRSVGRAGKAVVTAKAKLAATKTRKDAADAYQKKIDASLAEAKKAEPAAAKPIRAIAFSPNGKKLATAGDDNIVHLWDGNQGIQLEMLTGHTAVVSALSFGIGSTLVSGSADKSVAVWDTNPSWKLIGQLGPKKETPAELSSSVFVDRVLALDFSEDGKLLATGGGDPSRSGELMIWNVEKQSLVREVKDAHSDTVFGVEFSRDGKHILSGAADKFVKMFDLATGKHVRSFEGHTHHVLDVSWQADGSSIASAGADNVIKIWNVETGEQRRTISGHAKQVTSVDYIGVGQNIISCGGDKSVRFQQTSNGRTSRTFSGGTDYMYSADSTRDQKIVIAGGEDGVFRVWNGTNGKVIATFAPPKPPVEIPKDSKQASTSAVGGQK